MVVRVLRMIEYTYPDIETADEDIARWNIPANGTRAITGMYSIRSAIIMDPFHSGPKPVPPLSYPNPVHALGSDEFPAVQPGLGSDLIRKPTSHRKTGDGTAAQATQGDTQVWPSA